MRPAILRVLFALALVPLACGFVVVTYRDAGVTHWPARIGAAEQLREGRLPLVNAYASCGEPLAGNPNFGVFFPDTLLGLVLPTAPAFGAHFALAWAIGWLGARRWARAEGAPRDAAEISAYAFALSGPFLSAWSFYNAGMALALAPWALAGAAKMAARSGGGAGLRRAAAETGLAGALCALAGEPVVAAMAALASAVRICAGARAAALHRLLVSGGAAAVVAALVASPQILATAQAAPGSTRVVAGYTFENATVTSVHPVRALEQAAAFPFGRPDVMGRGGFDGHRYFQGRAPYLWLTHLGWIPIALAVAFARPWARGERLPWIAAAVGATLSLGAHLPFAEATFRLLSFGGRLRYPVKWWYLVALALVPIVARASSRWLAGREPRLARRAAAALLFAALAALGVWRALGDTTSLAGVAVSAAGAALVLAALPRPAGRRSAGMLLALAALVPLAVATPFLLALLDRPPRVAVRPAAGRVYERVLAQAHDPALRESEPALTTRAFFRRGPAELWALSGGAAGIPYAFDRDPDGSYSFWDRVMREATDAAPWPSRATELRIAGVASVVTRETPGPPFREIATLDAARGVRLYELPGALPSVRLVGRVLRAPHFNAMVAWHRDPSFDPATTTVLPGPEEAVAGEPATGRVDVRSETPSELIATTDLAASGVLVWQRTFFPAWRVEVDGARARTVAADGHLVAVELPPGRHEVRVFWPEGPVKAGALLAALGLAAAALLRVIRG